MFRCAHCSALRHDSEAPCWGCRRLEREMEELSRYPRRPPFSLSFADADFNDLDPRLEEDGRYRLDDVDNDGLTQNIFRLLEDF